MVQELFCKSFSSSWEGFKVMNQMIPHSTQKRASTPIPRSFQEQNILNSKWEMTGFYMKKSPRCAPAKMRQVSLRTTSGSQANAGLWEDVPAALSGRLEPGEITKHGRFTPKALPLGTFKANTWLPSSASALNYSWHSRFPKKDGKAGTSWRVALHSIL